MESKSPLLPQTHEKATADATMPRLQSKRRIHAAILAMLFGLFWLARTWNCEQEHADAETRVPMDVHIMSVLAKCTR
jgi:hypothetical protein